LTKRTPTDNGLHVEYQLTSHTYRCTRLYAQLTCAFKNHQPPKLEIALLRIF
jgi:hypothetical protein